MPLRMDHSPSPSSPTLPPPNAASLGMPLLTPEAISLATRFFNAARTGDLSLFQQAIPAGLPANLTNDKGDSILMLAAYHTHPAIVAYLLSHGADPNTSNDRGQSPLAGAIFKAAGAPGGRGAASAPGADQHEARSRNEGENAADQVVQLLLDAGADVNKGRPSAKESVEMFMVERWRGRICGIAAG